MDVFSCDVLVGGGGAGLRAAISVAEANPQLIAKASRLRQYVSGAKVMRVSPVRSFASPLGVAPLTG
jgi:succinate dehydrogenase/fumarate reductase flavoprotein subunit